MWNCLKTAFFLSWRTQGVFCGGNKSPVESNSNLAHLLYDLSKNLTSKISINALLIRLWSHLLASSELNTIWCLFHKL